jgi:hypothetical protein
MIFIQTFNPTHDPFDDASLASDGDDAGVSPENKQSGIDRSQQRLWAQQRRKAYPQQLDQ